MMRDKMFLVYIENQLIPALIEAGQKETAADVKTLLEIAKNIYMKSKLHKKKQSVNRRLN